MTEDEAKAKWCPFARVAGPMHSEAQGVSYNRWPGADGTPAAMLEESATALCIASGCMAWRTQHQWLDNAQSEPDWVSYAPYAFERGPGQERDDGYCGLVGAPQ